MLVPRGKRDFAYENWHGLYNPVIKGMVVIAAVHSRQL